MKKLFLLFALVGLAALSAQIATHQPGTVIFRTHPRLEPAQLRSALALTLSDYQLLSLKRVFPLASAQPLPEASTESFDPATVFELSVEAEAALPLLIASLEALPFVRWAEARYYHSFFFVPNDRFADTSTGPASQWYLKTIRAYEAWDLERGDTSVIVGITDSGTEYSHPDLRRNLAFNIDDPIDGIDNDHDGYIDNFRGWDFAGDDFGGTGDNDASAVDRHGISVTGIPGATVNNRIGVAGLGFDCRYLPLKVAPNTNTNIITHGYEAILYAAQQGAQIINCSWGSPVRSQFGAELIQFVQQRYGTLIIAACGNDAVELQYFPASYPGVLSISNVAYDDTACCPGFLNTTYNYEVDLAAPGYKIATTMEGGRYAGFGGTSASSPVVAGVAALTLAHFPGYTPFQVGERLRVTSDDIYQIPLNRLLLDKLGVGRVNALRALADPLKPSLRFDRFSRENLRKDSAPRPGDTLRLGGTWRNHLDASTAELTLEIDVPNGNQAQYVEILTRSWKPGAVPAGATLSGNPFLVRILPNAPENLTLDIRFAYLDPSLDYHAFEYQNLRVNSTIVDVTVNRVHTSFGSRGNFGYVDFPFNRAGLGVRYRGSQFSSLMEGGLLISANNEVIDALRGPNGATQQDFRIVRRAERLSSPLAPFFAETVFDDGNAPTPQNLLITQRIFAWDEGEAKDFVVAEYELENAGSGPLDFIYVNQFADWNLDQTPDDDFANYDLNNRLVYTYDKPSGIGFYHGIALLSDGNLRAAAGEVANFGFTETDKRIAAANTPTTPTATAGGGNGADVWQSIGLGPFSLAQNARKRVAFAWIVAGSITDLRARAEEARRRYRCYVQELGPTRAFLATTATGVIQPGDTVLFRDQNAGATAWRWLFGDGDSARGAVVRHRYNNAGKFPVSLTVTEGSCTVVLRDTIRVGGPPLSRALPIEPREVQVETHPTHWQLRWDPFSRPIELELIDLRGSVIWRRRAEAGASSARVPTATLARGVYVLRLGGRGVWKGVR